jgi:hypothetical protein
MCSTVLISFRQPRTRPESYTLQMLWSGLCHLHRIVSQLEKARLQQDPKAKDMMAISFDSDCGSDDPMLLNYFLWYSCNAHCFLELFSKAFNAKKDPSAFRNMRNFRHKAGGAHVSWANSQKRGRDPEGTRSASLRQFVNWNFGRYSVGREITSDLLGKESSPSDWGWELTKIHEDLDAFVRRNLPQTGTRRIRTSSAGHRLLTN